MECNRIHFPYTVLYHFGVLLGKKDKRLELTIHIVLNIKLSFTSFYRIYYITYYTFMYSNLMCKELEKLTHPEMRQQQCGSTL